MSELPTRLLLRLVLLQVAVHAVAFALTAAFSQPMLLLEEPGQARAALAVLAVLGVFAAAFSTFATLFASRALDPTLRALALGSDAIEPDKLIALYALPTRLATGGVLFVLAASLVVLVPGVRPASLDTTAAVALVLLLFTMLSTASLPAYLLMRASVARVLVLVPVHVAQPALRLLAHRLFGQVRRRLALAVSAPVAFVALGAGLLVDAHARDLAQKSRVAYARAVAHAVFTPLPSSPDVPRDPSAVVNAAEALGYRFELVESSSEPRERRDYDGVTHLAEKLDRGGVVRASFPTSRPDPAAGLYALLAVAAVALAGILAVRLAAAFEKDAALATREIRSAGVDQVMRGTMIQHDARFTMIRELLAAIDGLGGIFAEFASAQRRAIEAREATERMRGLLLASMSHDLKAPLNAVLGFAELVARGELTDAQHESLAIIEQRGRELLLLIDTILDSARAEAGELEVSPEPTHVGDVIMSAVLEARDLTVGTDVQVTAEIQPGMPRLFVDGTRIAQGLTAIVMTAARFSHKGIIPMRATLPGDGQRLRVEVETSGEGLPLAEREKIFDAFKSAESARRQGGLGLGLQLARSIVGIHGGSIEVEATEGGGIVFRVWLPVQEDRASIRARASQPRWEV